VVKPVRMADVGGEEGAWTVTDRRYRDLVGIDGVDDVVFDGGDFIAESVPSRMMTLAEWTRGDPCR
jgi:hypothetical protein